LGERVLKRSEALAASPILGYGLILLLQLRLIWNIWRYRDLTFGDTSYYFIDALRWSHGLRDNFANSPIYADFLGTIAALVNNVYAAVIIHRIIIVLAASLLVLALMRALLGPAIGLLVAIWWVVLPPNYDVTYEVHLFGLLPVLVAALIVARAPGRTRIGITLAVLVASTALLRNELVILTAIFTAAVVLFEVRARRRSNVPVSNYLRAYLVPLAVVALVVTGSYWRSAYPGLANLKNKHELNVCEAYAYSYQQRRPSAFPGNAMVNCSRLMRREFGRPRPTFMQALRANPKAIGEFMEWNLRLLPSGLQVALFGATATRDQPDYFLVRTHRLYTIPLTVLLVALLVAGTVAACAKPRFLPPGWIGERAWALLVLAGVVITTCVIILTQRPRPEYLYGLTIAILVFAGFCFWALLARVNLVRCAAPSAVVLSVLLLAAMSSHYRPGARPLHEAVTRLQIVRKPLQNPKAVLITSRYNWEICAYLASKPDDHCLSPDWETLQSRITGGARVDNVLRNANAKVIYADPALQSDQSLKNLLADPKRYGWRRVAAGVGRDGPWSILLPAS
jgi:hypothetical protein